MGCPLKSKCHAKLSEQLRAAREQRDAARIDRTASEADLRETIAIQQYQIQTLEKFCHTNLTESARKRAHGYRAAYKGVEPAPEHPCRTCGRCELLATPSGVARHFCTAHNHRVEGRRGTCPQHSSSTCTDLNDLNLQRSTHHA